jgi:hypothetical protein
MDCKILSQQVVGLVLTMELREEHRHTPQSNQTVANKVSVEYCLKTV